MFHRLGERMYNSEFSEVNTLRKTRSASCSQKQMCLKPRHAQGNVKAVELKAHPLKPILLTTLVNYHRPWSSVSWEENKSLLSTGSELEDMVSSAPWEVSQVALVLQSTKFVFCLELIGDDLI